MRQFVGGGCSCTVIIQQSECIDLALSDGYFNLFIKNINSLSSYVCICEVAHAYEAVQDVVYMKDHNCSVYVWCLSVSTLYMH